MVRSDGYAAVAAQAMPESANIESRRRRISTELPAQLYRMERTLQFARGALDGPDPEAALGYLTVLRDRLHEVLTDHS